MDCSVKKEQISVQKLFADAFDERPVDCDFVLPDYLPDIAAVLKSTMKPLVQSKQRSGDRLLVEGTVTVRTFYLDEGRKCVRCCEFSQPFSSSFLLKNVPDSAWICVSAKTDYINCRAVSPRRLDAHGAFTVKAKVFGTQSEEVACEAQGEQLYTKIQQLRYTVPAFYTEKNFSINETTELGADLPPAEYLMRADAVATVQECRQMNGKAILKGQVTVRSVYCSDAIQGTVHQTSVQLPFSQLIDVEGMTEQWICDVGAEISACDIHLTDNQNGENTLLSISVKLCAFIDCSREVEAGIVADAYSCRVPVELRRCGVCPEHLEATDTVRQKVCQTVHLPAEEAVEMVDFWADVFAAGTECGAEQATLEMRLLFCMLVRERDGNVAYYERVSDHSMQLPVRCDRIHWRTQVTDSTYSMTGDGQVEFCVQLETAYRCYREQPVQAVADIVAQDSAYPLDEAAMRVCFATAGEEVWEIAKRCRTSPDYVCAENALTDEILTEDTMLLIPLC